mmetsp:Transcript_37302/g.92838  ORF Transcript_37302/g.92838 Transcript_37302/m.92838 type:complete len:168 (-) Transcript_37302:12-515(-)
MWAWAQPDFRAAAGRGAMLACAELGHLDLLELMLAHRNDNVAYDPALWKRAGDAGHAHVLQWLLGRAAMLSPGDATQLNLCSCNIGDKGMLHLASALAANATVIRLHIACNEIGAIGAQHIAEVLKVNATVTELDLRGGNNIGAVGVRHITEVLNGREVNATVRITI